MGTRDPEIIHLPRIGLLRCRTDGTVLSADTVTLKILGLDTLPAASVTGKKIHDLCRFEQPFENYLPKIRSQGTLTPFDIQIRTPAGNEKWVQFHTHTFREEPGNEPVVEMILYDISGQKFVEKSLRERERLLENVFSSITDGICFVNSDFQIIHVNATLERWFAPMMPLVGKKCHDVFANWYPVCQSCREMGVIHPGPQQTCGQASSSQQEIDGRPSGYFDLNCFPVMDAETSKLVGMTVYIRDNTFQQKAINELQASQEMLKLVMDNIPEYIFWKDTRSVYLGCNKNFARFAGCESTQEIVGKTDADLHWNPDQAAGYLKAKHRVMESDMVEYHVIEAQTQADGKQVWIDANRIPLHDQSGRVVGMLGAFEDITQRKLAEEQIYKLYRAVEQSLHTIIIADSKGNIEYVNPRFTHITGFPKEDVLYKNLRNLTFWEMSDQEYFRFWETITGGKEWHGKIQSRRKNKEVFWESALFAPIRNPLGEITHFLGILEDITERIKAEEKIIHMAYYDPLTNLPNRALFNDRIALALAHAQRNRQMLAVMFVDLDRFRNINDTLGHDIGDRLVRGVTERLKNCLREGDTVARMGGDEFMLLLPGIENLQDVAKIANKISDVLKPPFFFDNHELHITASIGISLYPYDGEDPQSLLKNADTALNRAKEFGRNNYQLYTSGMNAKAGERLKLENSLRKAIEKEELLVYYQPQVDLNTFQIIGMEVLLRWQHPQNGLISPDQFIPLAEETGLIVPIGEWVLRTSCMHNKNWFSKYSGKPRLLSVNISACQFQQHKLMKTILGVLKDTGFDPNFLELEITESILMQKDTVPMAILRELKGMGIKFSIDDFGTGYSSLSYLKRFPIDTIKIDRSFIRDCISNPDDAAIVRAIVSMAASLKLRVVAEGVETREQLEFLRTLKCDGMQGYLFSKPLPPAEFAALLDRGVHLQDRSATEMF